MAGRMTVREAQEVLDAMPPVGNIVLRKDFQWVSVDGADFGGCTNYLCHGVYGDDQPVEYRGLTLTVYGPNQTAQQETRTFVPGDDLAGGIADMRRNVRAMCPHPRSREMGSKECRERGIQHMGSCYHVYECFDCHAIFAHDSSD